MSISSYRLEHFLKTYLRERPFFLSLIRAKEASLYQKYLPLKRPVLDFSCGDGFFAEVAFDKKIDVGLDIKNSWIKEAKKLGVYKKIVTYDGEKIPFPNNYFSTIVSNCVLEHIENLDFSLGEIFRILGPNGWFLTTVMAKPWEDYLFGVKLLGNFYKKWMRKKQAHFHLLTYKKWQEAFQKVGFKVKKSIGYLTPLACAWIDFLHYVSIPSLISYRLFGRWVFWPELTEYICPKNYFLEIIKPEIGLEKAGAAFFVLEK